MGYKTYSLIFLFSMGFVFGMAQVVPQSMNYQAIIRDAGGNPLSLSTADIRFTYNNGSGSFQEEFLAEPTNQFGVLTVEMGTVNVAQFQAFDWKDGAVSIQVEVRTGGAYVSIGNAPLNSVPYSFVANDLAQLSGNPVNTTTVANDDVLTFDGTEWIAKAPLISPWITNAPDIYYNAGNVGIGTIVPAAKLDVLNGAVIFQGTTGATPVSGSGTRFMWVPSKRAIRAGSIIGTEWDDANIGTNSASFGGNNTSSGSHSTTIGQANTASGSRSFAGGVGSVGSGNGSMALGEGALAETRGGFAAGHYNIGGGTAGSFAATDPVFEVGIGASSASRANALTILHGGNMGVGIHAPDARLSVLSTGLNWDLAATEGDFLLASTTGTYKFKIGMATGGGGAGDVTLGAEGGTNRMFLGTGAADYQTVAITGGNVGIGVITPVNKLDVEGGAVIGAAYAGSSTAPVDGLLVKGKVGINYSSTNPPSMLTIGASSAVSDIRLSVTDALAPFATSSRIDMSNYHGLALLPAVAPNSTFRLENDYSGFALKYSSNNLSTFTEYWTVLADGKMGVRTTAPAARLHVNSIAAEPAFRAQVNGATKLMVHGDGTVTVNTAIDQAYAFYVSGTAAKTTGGSTWTVASDNRLKKNIHPFKDGLNVLRQINPMYFNYNGKTGIKDTSLQIGVIAQEMEQIAPYTVSTFNAKLNEDDEQDTALLNFDFSAINYVLINAVKEQQAQIELLNFQLNKVKNITEQQQQSLETLKAELTYLKSHLKLDTEASVK